MYKQGLQAAAVPAGYEEPHALPLHQHCKSSHVTDSCKSSHVTDKAYKIRRSTLSTVGATPERVIN